LNIWKEYRIFIFHPILMQFFCLNWLCRELAEGCWQIYSIAYGFEDKQKEANKNWIPKFDLSYFSSNFKCRFFAKWSYGLL